MSPRPQVDHIRKPQILKAAGEAIARKGVTVDVGHGNHLVALEQATYRSSPDDRWEPGSKVKLGWHPEHALVLR